MATPLKDLYNDTFFAYFLKQAEAAYPGFKSKAFLKAVYAGNWENLELKERMRKSADALRQVLPGNFQDSVDFIHSFAQYCEANNHRGFGLELMFLPDFVERYGIENPNLALPALESITRISSAEFAVRPFMNRYPERMHTQMLEWSRHENEWVRRLASEGFRPRLPWGLAVPHLKKDPSPILLVLENLKTDSSETVRRSVANNLNDISKDHPERCIQILNRWRETHPETERIIKHASRSLLKKGNSEVLDLFGAGDASKLDFSIASPLPGSLAVGESLPFGFSLQNTAKKTRKIRIEYVLYFRLKNGDFGRKAFYMSEQELQPGQRILLNKKHSFRPITTRRYYNGKHKLCIQINGKEFDMGEFNLRGADHT